MPGRTSNEPAPFAARFRATAWYVDALKTVREQTRKAVVWILVVGCIALFASGFVEGLGKRSTPALTAADRTPLIDETVAGQRRLRHPTLGFSFHHPGATFAPSQKVTDAMQAAHPDKRFHYYAFVDDPPTTVVEIAMMNEDVPNREAMVRELAELEKSFGSKGKAATYDDGVTWTDQLHDAHFAGEIDGEHIRVRMIPISPKDHPQVVVALIVASQDPNALADTLASFGP
jgi:hypothetical protein